MKFNALLKPLALSISLAIAYSATASDSQNFQAQQEIVQINSANQIPNKLMQLQSLPSELIFSEALHLSELENFLSDYVDMLEEGYVFNDITARRQFQETRLALHLAQKRWPEAIAMIEQIRQLSEKAAAKQVTAIIPYAYAKAALAAGTEQGDKFQQTFAKEFDLALEAVDLSVARNEIKELLGRRQVMTANFMQGYAKANIDEPAKMANLNLPVNIIQTLLSAHRMIKAELPLRDIITASLSQRLASEAEVVKENRWEQREVAIEQGQMTLVAIWDTGIDIQLQQDRMWLNPDKSAINRHGIAFDEYFSKQPENLLTRVNDYDDEIQELLGLLKGYSDQRSNQDTQAARDFQAHIASLKPEALGEFQTKLGDMGTYSHGQMVADVAAKDIQPVQLMNVMMSWPNIDIYKQTPLDEAYVAKLIAAAEESVAFMRKHKVRVANLSWRLSMPMFEQILLGTGTESDAQKAKIRAEKMFHALNNGLKAAFASAPEILFVAGAGNEDENVEFVKSTPAGINLPNLITVGAVDPSLQPTSFTSFGASIDLYANGYEVPARMPGGMLNKASGTSIAAPLVTNLAAKILSQQPELKPEQVIALMQKHATLESQQQLPVVHPEATLCALAPELNKCEQGKVASAR